MPYVLKSGCRIKLTSIYVTSMVFNMALKSERSTVIIRYFTKHVFFDDYIVH